MKVESSGAAEITKEEWAAIGEKGSLGLYKGQLPSGYIKAREEE
ncbi:unnamed protein product [marine sediment metagenome]|uniref:Uncharacterized protein n=1 Tax=marine sediment metagenome TaxID=412755 RepID=X1MBY3_9ZZZZ